MNSNIKGWQSGLDASIDDECDNSETEADEEHEESDAESDADRVSFGDTLFGSSENEYSQPSTVLSDYERAIHEATYEGDSEDVYY